MTEQSPDPDLKENNYRKWIEGQSTEVLEKELHTLKLRRTALQIRDRGMEAHIKLPEQEDEEEGWEEDWGPFEARMSPKEFAEFVADMDAEFEAQEKAIARYEEIQAMEPEERARLEAERDARVAASEAAERRERLAKIDQAVLASPWITEQLHVAQQIEAVQRELAARRTQELSRGEPKTTKDVATREAPEQKRLGPLFPRSPLRRTIQSLFIREPAATARRICFLLDDESVDLRDDWKNGPNVRNFKDAYASDKKPMIDKYISRIRTRMQKDKLV
jgi:hypothetical protein